MDGLDELMREVEVKKTKNQRAPSLSVKISDSSTPLVEATQTATTNNEEIEFVAQQLKDFMIDIADNEIQRLVNESLQSQIRYDRFIQYYLENANLSHYSIEAELNRMDFTVTHQQKQTSNKNEILDIFYETRLDDMWRFANQSVYADLLVAIQHYYNNSELLISTVASSSRLFVNLDERSFEACCVFDFVVESDAVVTNRLKLGSIEGWLRINLKRKLLEQFVNSPRIPVVFDDDIRSSLLPLLSLSATSSTNRAAARTVLQSYYSQQSLEVSSSRSLRSVISQYAGRVVQSLPSLPRAASIPSDSSSSHPSTAVVAPTASVSHLTESMLEGVVGSFGRWLGADKTSDKESTLGSNGFGDLRAALDRNEELLEAHRRNGRHLQSLSSNPEPQAVAQSDDWEEW